MMFVLYQTSKIFSKLALAKKACSRLNDEYIGHLSSLTLTFTTSPFFEKTNE